jgi:hypothetical protein
MSFKPVYNNNAAQINTDEEANIVRTWIKANWAVPGILDSDVDFEFIHEDRNWEGKMYVINFYCDPPTRRNFEVSPNSKEVSIRCMIDVWVNDPAAYTAGTRSPDEVKIHKWLENFIDSNPGGLEPYGIGLVEIENYRFIPFGPQDDANWFHYVCQVMLTYLLVKQ